MPQSQPGRRAGCFGNNARCSCWFVFGEFPVKCGEADAQKEGGLFLVAADVREDAVKIGAFLFAQIIF